MRDIVAVYLTVTVAVSLCGRGATTDIQPHQHRRRHEWSRKHIVHLQNTVDRLLLQQQIDHIHLNNLQKTVQSLQKREGSLSMSPLSTSIGELEAEERALSSLGKKAAEVRDTMRRTLQSEQHHDEMLQMRQELAYLRSEMQRVKETRATASEWTVAHTKAQEHREAVTGAWVVENVRRLQDSVVELQEALNVTQALHDKQEIESRLTVVTKDLNALRSSLAAVTSKAEAAAAMSTTVQDELTRTADDMHRLAGKTGVLSTEVSAIREDFNNLLAALPEGTLAGHNAPQGKQSAGNGMTGVTSVASNDDGDAAQARRLAALEVRTDQLDFALTHTQQQVSSLIAESVNDERVAQLVEKGRQLEREVEAASTGVGEVRLSSVQLLAALEALEAKMEKDMTEVKQEVAKLEFKVAESAAAQLDKKHEDKVTHDDIAALRSDLQTMSRRLDQLTLKLVTLESRKLEEEVGVAQCRTQHLSFDLKLNDTMARVKAMEEQWGVGSRDQSGHKHHSQHKYYLQPWSSTPRGTARGHIRSPAG